MVSKTAEITPRKTKAFLLTLASLGVMFYYSWWLTLAVLGGLIVIGVFYLMTLRCLGKTEDQKSK
jgi:ABC-type bacteriocin/lantibiotic exporter with double-glycine peptidase domain